MRKRVTCSPRQSVIFPPYFQTCEIVHSVSEQDGSRRLFHKYSRGFLKGFEPDGGTSTSTSTSPVTSMISRNLCNPLDPQVSGDSAPVYSLLQHIICSLAFMLLAVAAAGHRCCFLNGVARMPCACMQWVSCRSRTPRSDLM